ncbi:RmlC-like cupin domain-containing protein [Xylaria intraflava]|nr:RmlC-like cupin domain-containing protein [Xylaria intraflava]
MLRRALLAACIASAALSQATPCDNDPVSSSLDVSCHSAQEIIDVLGLVPSAEGGYYFETFRDTTLLPSSNRSISTAIYYLIEGPNVPSAWHSVDAAEVWHWYAGAPLTLEISQNNGSPTTIHHLGPQLFQKQRPQAVIPAHDWQRALSWGNWTLVGTTVAPAFVPEGYAQAQPGWTPRGA